MAQSDDGWRSARSRKHFPAGAVERPREPTAAPLRTTGAPAPVAPVAPVGRRPRAVGADQSAPSAAATPARRQTLGSVWKLITEGVEWTPLYVGLLVYMYSTVTRVVAAGDVAMTFCLVALLLQKDRMRFPPFLITMAVFAVWAVVGYATTSYPDLVWQGAYDLIKLWAIVLVAVNALRTRAQLRFFMIFFLGCFALYPLRGAYFNYYIYGHRPFGRAVWKFIYANPNDLAMLTLLQVSMAAGLLMSEGRGLVRTAALSGMGMLTLLIFMTQSRGAIVGLAVFGVAALVYSKRDRLKTVLVFAAVAVVLAVFAPKRVWDRLEGLKNVTSTEDLREVDKEGSAEQRFEIWKVARKVIAYHPVFGVGLQAYPAAHNEFSQHSEFKKTALGWRDTHSTLLNVTAEMGFPGAVIFLLVFGSVAVRAERVRRRARAVVPRTAQQLLFLELGLLAFFFAGLFGSYAHLAFAYIHLVLVWAFAESTAEEVASLAAPVRRGAWPDAAPARVGAGLPRRRPA